MRPIKTFLRGVVALALISLALGCSRAAWYEELGVTPTELGSMGNASQFGNVVYFGAQPAEKDFELFAATGIRTVLNLRTEKEMEDLGFDEEAAAQKSGLSYFNIPVGREQPSEETLELIAAIIDDEERHPLLLHCASSNRVGFAWAVYRGRRTGLTIDEALEEGKQAGMRSPVLGQWVRNLLETAPEGSPIVPDDAAAE